LNVFTDGGYDHLLELCLFLVYLSSSRRGPTIPYRYRISPLQHLDNSPSSTSPLATTTTTTTTITMTILERPLVTISLQNYDSRKEELITQLITASEESGFFALTDHGITETEISNMFVMSKRFFSLPEKVKTKYHFEGMKVVLPPLPDERSPRS
jgi:non-haem dioxygenase in morphine synthesis N-terminal